MKDIKIKINVYPDFSPNLELIEDKILIPIQTFYENGQLESEYFIDLNGELQGEYKDYYYSGELYTHTHYKDNKEHGECRLYNDNGNLKEHISFNHDKWHGICKFYDENGQLVNCELYENDEYIKDVLNGNN